MKLLENKGLAIIIMAALIIGGFWLGGYKSLSGLYQNVEDVFFTGEDGDGICIANDLAERETAAGNLITIARKYMGESDVILQVSNAAARLAASAGSDNDIEGCLTANQALDTAMESLYRGLGELNLSEKDEAYRQRLYADFNSRGDTISHDPYNQYAQAYNQTLDGFPASLLAAITPVHKAVIFY